MEEILAFPYNRDFWFQNGVGEQRLGDLMVNADLGRLIRYMMEAEQQALAAGASRSEGIRAARDAFYKGEPARDVDRFFREQGGIVRYEDLANYESRWEEPLHASFQGYDVYTGDGWSQGPRIVLMLNMLENQDLRALGYNTPAYIHLLSQVINLAMSDSHKYVGDPDFAPAPDGLYGKEYARERIGLIDEKRAFQDMPPWGDPAAMAAVADGAPTSFVVASGAPASPAVASADGDGPARSIDTSSLNVMDGEGNLFSLTESDGHTFTPLIPGWGFGLGNRMGQFNLDPELANVMAPRQAPAQHQLASSGDEGRPAVHGTLHPRRRPAVAVAPAGLPERGRVGDVARAGAGPAALRQLQLPGLGQRGERQSRGAPPRGPHPGRDGGSAARDGARRRVLGHVELARVRTHGDLARPGDGRDDRGGGRAAGDCVAGVLRGREADA